jgi:hypothetical protein
MYILQKEFSVFILSSRILNPEKWHFSGLMFPSITISLTLSSLTGLKFISKDFLIPKPLAKYSSYNSERVSIKI